jgi:hypothetical protein
MNRFGLGSKRVGLNLILAAALATTGAFAAVGGVAAAAPTAKVPVPAPTVQVQNLASWLGGIQDGTSASTTLSGGYILTASRVGGQKVITVKSFHPKLGVTPSERFPFCVWIVSAAVYGVGAAVFALAAALGWEIVLPFGVVVSPWLAGVIAASLAAGASINTLVGTFLC